MKAFWMASFVLAGGLLGCNGGDNNGGDASVVDAGPAKAAIQDTSVDFGSSDCGGNAAAAKTVTIQNTGGAPLTWSAKLDSTDAFQLQGVSSGTIGGSGSAQVTIAAKPISSATVAGQQFLAELTITTSDPSLASVNVPVSLKAQGATIVLLPEAADFGLYTVGQQAPDINLTLTNTGNKDATVAFLAPPDPQFSIDWTGAPTGVTVPAGGTTPMPGLKARFKAASTASTSTSAPIQVTGAGVCGVSATKIDLKGQGTNGALVYSPGTLDFGLTDCGTAASAQTFTLANTGNASLSWSASPTSGTPYSLSTYGGVLLANTQQVVTVTPLPIPVPSDVTANLYGTTFTLTTNASGDTAHTLTMKQTAHGAILQTNSATLDYTSNAKPGDTKTLAVSNVGNAKANVYFNTDTGNFSVNPTTNPTTIAGGANQNFVVTAEGNILGPMNASIKLDYDPNVGVLCKPLPSATTITGSMSMQPTSIVAHGFESCAIGSGGRAYCWGSNNYWLGYAFNLVSTRPYGFSSVSAMSLEFYSNYYSTLYGLCAADSSGAVTCRQYNNGSLAISNLGSGVTQLAISDSIACALKGDAVYCWKAGSSSATQIVSSNAASITMGNFQNGPSLGVVMTDGSFWLGWPLGSLSQVSAFSNIVSASIGGNQACAVDNGGAVWCFGYNYDGEVNGQPYNPYYVDPSSPTQVLDTDGKTPLSGAKRVAAGGAHTCAIRSDKSVVCWGQNYDGQLGNGNTNYSYGTYQAGSFTDAQSIVAGDLHTCALRSSGAVTCWGYNGYAQVAGNTTSPYVQPTPTDVPYL
jgi:alpha-tubulin suppressor-like RCC1 family protein